ncbi:hypothetical protein NEOLEDRAFT_1139853 [Neolentinus lepideus HHB14362 ss-1]|uniref:N-acetyltransferase domain-containing protein n=1 Tax=Neolentinus lepideus HHB14362 ss-1 TaxID=1314782 RepID=A0A165PLF5_9AGAM|nr:hypothetical protein NEOLEDRAFT_1139853 [Neolentinus lepideus HHB14362 ss-1]
MESEPMDSEDEYQEYNPSRAKRRRVSMTRSNRTSIGNDGPTKKSIDLTSLIDPAESNIRDVAFETIIDELLPDLIRTRDALLRQQAQIDQYGQPIRPMTRCERALLIDELQSKSQVNNPLTFLEAMILRKLKVNREKGLRNIPEQDLDALMQHSTVTPLPPVPASPPVNPDVLAALYSIRTTPYENSFLSRLLGVNTAPTPGLVAVDWETCSPWISLMDDIRDHYSLAHPDREQVAPVRAPIEYVSLQPLHLDQVHDLLARTFWSGIDVSDSLHYSPEKCSIIATYKKLVVGAAFLSSPQEAYITYMAVRTGWENSQIATNMLYHLITLNPNKDITLHVSVNNPAMQLLYNRFGFKAEEFIANFYDAYLDPQSRASKNAFRLRLRR